MNLASHFTGDKLNMIRASYVAMFQTGWFVESMWSQSLVIHMIRTMKLPFIQSRASAQLTLLNFFGIIFITIIPFTLLGKVLGFSSLPLSFFLFLLPCVLAYMILVTAVKKGLYSLSQRVVVTVNKALINYFCCRSAFGVATIDQLEW